MNTRGIVVVALGLACTLVGLSARAGDVRMDEFGIRFHLPDDATQVEIPGAAAGQIARAYRWQLSDHSPVVLAISSMPGVIGRERLTLAAIPASATASMANLRLAVGHWREFDVDVMVGEPRDAPGMTTRVYQLPIKPQSLNFAFFGRTDHARELEATSEAIVATLDGPTNWLTVRERVGAGLRSLVGFGVIIGLIVVVIVGRRRAKRSEPSATG